MGKPRYLLIEDDYKSAFFIKDTYEAWGFELAGHIETYEAAMRAIENLVELGVVLVLLDGNLTDREDDGAEGGRIADYIRRVFPTILIIGISNSGVVEGAHYNVRKYEVTSVRDFLPTLRALLEKFAKP